MIDYVSSWVIVFFAALGVTAAVVAFLRTPREQRYRGVPRKSLAEQLKDCPKDAHAVIIKGNRRRALKTSAPYILIGAVLVGFSISSMSTSNPECVRLLGLNASYISLVLFCYGMPIGFLIASLLSLNTGIKAITTGYFPPLDAVVFNDTIAKKGTASLLRGVVLLALPAFALFIVYLSDNAFTVVADGRNQQELSAKLEAKCPET